MIAKEPSKPMGRKRTVLLIVGFLAVAVGMAWGLDGWLLARLRMIASGMPIAEQVNPQLFHDDSEALLAYSPKRLAKFLSIPSAQMRIVVCLSLAERHDERDPAAWVGVVPKLLAATVDDPDEMVRAKAKEVLFSLPCIPPEDVEAVFALVEGPTPVEGLPRELTMSLLRTVSSSNPDQMQRVIAVYRRWLDSPEIEVRRAAFNQLLQLTPTAAETAAVFQKAVRSGDPDRIVPGSAKTMMHHDPRVIDQFLGGDESQWMLVLKIAREERVILRSPSDLPKSDFPLSEGHLAKLQALAMKHLLSKAPAEPAPAKTGESGASRGNDGWLCYFLGERPSGPELLLDVARKTTGKRKALALNHARAWLYHSPSGPDPTVLDDLLPWLREDDADVQFEVVRFLEGYSHLNWLKVQKTGRNAPVIVALRRFIDEFPDRLDRRVIEMMIASAPTLENDDVDRLANASRKALERIERDLTKDQRRNLRETDAFTTWLRRFPEHQNRPAVKRFIEFRAKFAKAADD
jgi:hypothetical protein